MNGTKFLMIKINCLILLLFLSGCSVYGPWVKEKDFDDYKTLHTFEHINLNNGILFNEEKLEAHKDNFNKYISVSRIAAEETNKKFEKELADLTSFYLQLDRDIIDYIWHDDKIIEVR